MLMSGLTGPGRRAELRKNRIQLSRFFCSPAGLPVRNRQRATPVMRITENPFDELDNRNDRGRGRSLCSRLLANPADSSLDLCRSGGNRRVIFLFLGNSINHEPF